jgi:hypothetical protein
MMMVQIPSDDLIPTPPNRFKSAAISVIHMGDAACYCSCQIW